MIELRELSPQPTHVDAMESRSAEGKMFKTRVETDLMYGRYMVATEPLRKGDLIIEEMPFAFGPKQQSDLVCLGCYRYLHFGEDGESQDRCEHCDWPLCSECVDHPDHKAECQIFAKAKVTFSGNVGEDGVCTQLDCVTPLRVLLAKEANPQRWDSELEPMEHHDLGRRENSEAWYADLVNVAQYLRGPCKLASRFSEDLIMQVVGILEVNAFEARTPQGFSFRVLYPLTSVLAHNCVPNTTRSIYSSEGYKIRLRAMRDLNAGEQLQHAYTYTLNGTFERQSTLKTGKYFTCTCERCKDPTELGTNFSTIKCSKCEDGYMTPSDPLDVNTEWACNLCEFKLPNLKVQHAVTVMQAEVALVQVLQMDGHRLEETEKLYRKYRSVVHPLHFIQTGLRQSLIEMYGRVSGYEMAKLPDVLLERKEELCRQVLRVLTVFEPGLSRTRAMTLYELHVPIVLLAKSAFIAEVLTGEALKQKLQGAIDILKECVSILQHEDASSQEGILCKVAQQALEQLSLSVEGLSGGEPN